MPLLGIGIGIGIGEGFTFPRLRFSCRGAGVGQYLTPYIEGDWELTQIASLICAE